MRLPRRRTFWLIAALLLVVVIGAGFLAGRSLVTRANFDRIQYGMSEEDVNAILGADARLLHYGEHATMGMIKHIQWRDGPNWVEVGSRNGKVYRRQMHIVATWEYLIERAKTGAERIGVRWK